METRVDITCPRASSGCLWAVWCGFWGPNWSSARKTSALTSGLLHRPLPRSSNSASEPCVTPCCPSRQNPLFWCRLTCGVVKEPCEDRIFPSLLAIATFPLLLSTLPVAFPFPERAWHRPHLHPPVLRSPRPQPLGGPPASRAGLSCVSTAVFFSSFQDSPREARVVLLHLILPCPRHLQVSTFLLFQKLGLGRKPLSVCVGCGSWMTHWGLLTGTVKYEKIPRSPYTTRRSPLVLFPVKKCSFSEHCWELSFPHEKAVSYLWNLGEISFKGSSYTRQKQNSAGETASRWSLYTKKKIINKMKRLVTCRLGETFASDKSEPCVWQGIQIQTYNTITKNKGMT